MRYAGIDEFEVINGTGIGISLYVQGCHFKCNNCFNPETWDFNNGYEWTNDIESYFFKLIERDYIKRISFLGGDPLANENVCVIFDIINKIKNRFPDKKIWMYTGYTWENIFNDFSTEESILRQHIVTLCNYLVDGQYIDKLHKANLLFKGSSNQRVINVFQSIYKNCIVEEYKDI